MSHLNKPDSEHQIQVNLFVGVSQKRRRDFTVLLQDQVELRDVFFKNKAKDKGNNVMKKINFLKQKLPLFQLKQALPTSFLSLQQQTAKTSPHAFIWWMIKGCCQRQSADPGLVKIFADGLGGLVQRESRSLPVLRFGARNKDTCFFLQSQLLRLGTWT